jgi:hypothetical protein
MRAFIRSSSLIIVFSGLFLSTSFGQDMVVFDEPPANGAYATLQNIGGGDMLIDGNGVQVDVHPVFSLGIDQRIDRGYTTPANRDMSGTRGAIGPTFNLTYIDVVNATGKGFDDPALGSQRRQALEAVFAYVSGVIENDGDIDVEIRESFFASPTSNPFAFSAPYFFGSKGFNAPFTQYHVTTGSDPTSAFPDGYIQFNFSDALNYNLNTGSQPSAAQYDFFTVALHEVMHLLGFTSYLNEMGVSAASNDVFTSFDGLLFDFNKDPMLTVTGSGTSATVSKPSAAILTNDQVWVELGPSQYAPVYSPSSFNGSSLDHLDNGRSSDGEYVMHPSLNRGEAIKYLHQHEGMILQQIGYQVNMSVATSIGDEEAFGEAAGNLYPNPAVSQGKVQINIGKVQDAEILVVVYDMMGRQSYSKVVMNNGPGPVTAIDPYNNLAPGMYIVVGTTKGELFNQKLVIR